MEKSNSRNRRGGKGSESESSAVKSSGATTKDATQVPVITTKWEPPEIEPGQGGNEQSSPDAGTSTMARPTARGLQDTFIDERNDVLAVINELEDQLDRHQEIRETLERELTGTSENLQSANQRVQELEWQVVTLQTRVDALEQLRTDVAALEEELGDANGRLQRTTEQLALTDKERGRLKNELKAANKQVDELWPVRKERDGLKSECKMLSTKVDELERNQRELTEERANLQSRLHETEITLEETTTERNKLQMTLRGAEDRIRELVSVQEALDDKIDSLRAEKKNLQVQMTHLERENARLVEQRQFYECEVTSLRNQGRTAETALNSVKKAFSEVRVALTETKSRARRRALDSWPRIGSPLRGLTEQEMHDRGGVDIPIAATIGAESESEQSTGQTRNANATVNNVEDNDTIEDDE